jgi:hypothetical protein
MPVVALRKNIFITKSALNTRSWSQEINIDFVPDVMIVKGFAYQDNGTTTTFYVLRSSLVDYNTMLTFVRGDPNDGITPHYTPTDIVFDMKKPVRGNYTFEFLDVSGDPATININFALHLEFVRYNIKHATN